jgi:hypothetical protein
MAQTSGTCWKYLVRIKVSTGATAKKSELVVHLGPFPYKEIRANHPGTQKVEQ